MNDNSLARLGGTCSMLVGISYLVTGIAYLLAPAEQRNVADPTQVLASYAQSSSTVTVVFWSLALGAVFAIAAVLAVSERVESVNRGWVRWTQHLAIIGFALTAVQNFRFLGLYPGRVATYLEADAVTRAAMDVNQSLMVLDPQGWLVSGGIGIWLLVVNLLGLRDEGWPNLLAYLGIAGAVGYWLFVIGNVIQLEPLVAIAAGSAVTIGPAWYIWAGLMLRRSSSASANAAK